MSDFSEYGYDEDFQETLQELLEEAREFRVLKNIPSLNSPKVPKPEPPSDDLIQQLAAIECEFDSDF